MIWMPLCVLVLIGALLAFRTGWIYANLDASQAIAVQGARYMEETGADAANCTAVPGERAWLVVRCGPEGAVHEYHLNRFGVVIERFGPGDDPATLTGQREPRT